MKTQFITGPKRHHRILLISFLLLSLAIASAAGAGDSGVGESDRAISKAAASSKSQAAKTKGPSSRILFDYYPSPLFPRSSEHVFVAIANDGITQAVRYGQHSPAIIAVYEGRIPKAEVVRLTSLMESVIPKAAEINKPYVGSCDADQFQLSLSSQNRSVTQLSMAEPGCLLMMPEEIRRAVEEMRTMWRRLNEARLMYGYVRSFPLSEDFLKSIPQNARRFVSIRRFRPKLRAIVRNAIRQTPKYDGLNQAQSEHLKSLASGSSHFYVIDNGAVHSLMLILSRKPSQSPP